jgi:hypothetical protein
MWFFDKDKAKGKADIPAKAADAPAKPMTSKEIKTQQLLAQMRTLRAEIGEETLQELVKKLKFDELKNKVRRDIENDPKKRDRLLDELRLHVRDDD